MSLKLPARKKPGAALRAVLLTLARGALRDLESVESHPEKHIHSLRTGMKKYRSLLRLADGSVGKRRRTVLLDRVAALKDGLAGSRDDAVVFQTVNRVLGNDSAERLNLARPHAGETRAPASLLAAARELVALTESLGLGKIKTNDLEKAWRRAMRKGSKARKRAKASGGAHDFHGWRKRAKDMWYQSVALSGRLEKAAEAVKGAKKLSDDLGEEHDLTVVLDSVKALTRADRAALSARREKLRGLALAR